MLSEAEAPSPLSLRRGVGGEVSCPERSAILSEVEALFTVSLSTSPMTLSHRRSTNKFSVLARFTEPRQYGDSQINRKTHLRQRNDSAAYFPAVSAVVTLEICNHRSEPTVTVL